MLRELCPALANKHYFNYGGQGPLPTPSLEAMVACWQELRRTAAPAQPHRKRDQRLRFTAVGIAI